MIRKILPQRIRICRGPSTRGPRSRIRYLYSVTLPMVSRRPSHWSGWMDRSSSGPRTGGRREAFSSFLSIIASLAATFSGAQSLK